MLDGGSGRAIELIARLSREPRDSPCELDVTAEFDSASEQGHESRSDREPPTLSAAEPRQESCEQRDHRLQQETKVSADHGRLPSVDKIQHIRVRIGCGNKLCKPSESHQRCGCQEHAE